MMSYSSYSCEQLSHIRSKFEFDKLHGAILVYNNAVGLNIFSF